jgi:hypothetical protein
MSYEVTDVIETRVSGKLGAFPAREVVESNFGDGTLNGQVYGAFNFCRQYGKRLIRRPLAKVAAMLKGNAAPGECLGYHVDWNL